MRIGHILEWMEAWAPRALAVDWDNPGLLVGDRSRETDTVLTALEISGPVVEEAMAVGAGLIVTHHPLIFGKIGQVNGDTALGRTLLTLIENQVAVFAAHTNLDRARGGTNELLCRMLGLQNVGQLGEEKGGLGMGRIGTLPRPLTLAELAEQVRSTLGLPVGMFAGDGSQTVSQVAVCTGAGGDLLEAAQLAGAQVLITGDVKHHLARDAAEMGMALIDGTHFGTEVPIAGMIAGYLNIRAKQEGASLRVLTSRREQPPVWYQWPGKEETP